jgi:hypothetical protein
MTVVNWWALAAMALQMILTWLQQQGAKQQQAAGSYPTNPPGGPTVR